MLLVTWYGRQPFALLVAAAFVGVTWEFGMMCRWRPVPLLLGLPYAALAMLSFWVLRSYGAFLTLFTLAVVWSSDVGAYLAGRLLGGPRLAPAISPGKTWSGAVGGLVAAMTGGVASIGDGWSILPLAAVMGVASQLGDLGESALKRHYGVKDSGRLIPGHGGLLDRLDGLMAASLVVAGTLWLKSIGYDLLG